MAIYVIRAAEKAKLADHKILVENLTAATVTNEAIANARTSLELAEEIPFMGICRALMDRLTALNFNITSQNTGQPASTNANIPREILLEQNQLNQEVVELNARLLTAVQVYSIAQTQAQVQAQLQAQAAQQQNQQPQQQLIEAMRAVFQPILQNAASGEGSSANASRARVPYLSDKIEFPSWDQEKDPDPINWFQIIDNNWTPLQEAEWTRQGHSDPVDRQKKKNL